MKTIDKIMKIGFDFDGVISDCGKLKSDGAKQLYGVDISPAEFKKEIVVGKKYLTMDEYRQLQKSIYGTRELGFLMEPVSGVLDYLPQLTSEHDVSIITSRDGNELEIAKEWSVRHGLALNFIGVGYGVSKADAAVGFDFYVDDDMDKLQPLINIVPHRFLFSWGYNAHIEVGDVAKRIASWEEIYHTIQDLKNKP